MDTPTTPAPTPRKGPKCINCNTNDDGAYGTDDNDVGPFCSLCWDALEHQFAASLASLVSREERLREALTAIEQSTREDERGEHWTIRAYLDKHGIFHGDIGTSRRLVVEACKVGLYSPAKPTEAKLNPHA